MDNKIEVVFGIFGASAEYSSNDGSQGKLFINKNIKVKKYAVETYLPKSTKWSQCLAFSVDNPVIQENNTLKYIGDDDKGYVYDLGVNNPYLKIMLRYNNRYLDRYVNENFLENNDLWNYIIETHPHRIFENKIGKLEIYQKIGGKDTNNITPLGCHTHILPKLLKHNLTHSKNMIFPSNFIPLVFAYFPQERYNIFQKILKKYGNSDYNSIKNNVFHNIINYPTSRLEKTATRIALRQLKCNGVDLIQERKKYDPQSFIEVTND